LSITSPWLIRCGNESKVKGVYPVDLVLTEQGLQNQTLRALGGGVGLKTEAQKI